MSDLTNAVSELFKNDIEYCAFEDPCKTVQDIIRFQFKRQDLCFPYSTAFDLNKVNGRLPSIRDPTKSIHILYFLCSYEYYKDIVLEILSLKLVDPYHVEKDSIIPLLNYCVNVYVKPLSDYGFKINEQILLDQFKTGKNVQLYLDTKVISTNFFDKVKYRDLLENIYIAEINHKPLEPFIMNLAYTLKYSSTTFNVSDLNYLLTFDNTQLIKRVIRYYTKYPNKFNIATQLLYIPDTIIDINTHVKKNVDTEIRQLVTSVFKLGN